MKASELLSKLKTYVLQGRSYIETCPADLKEYVQDNVYSSAAQRSFEAMIYFEFDKSADLVFEWLYDDWSSLYKLSAEELVEKLDEDWKQHNTKYEVV